VNAYFYEQTSTYGENEMKVAPPNRIARLRRPLPEDLYPIALELGVRIGLRPSRLQTLRDVARHHDIGKCAIPAAILAKPTALDESEREFVREHPEIGARMLAASAYTVELAPLVRSTHERWDGSGNPDRLRGEEIPLESRIVAICDAFVAMTSPRPFRATKTEEEALREIARQAGTQFDPALVQEFQMMMIASEKRAA
jgi:two-component system, cell cycle response regulator